MVVHRSTVVQLTIYTAKYKPPNYAKRVISKLTSHFTGLSFFWKCIRAKIMARNVWYAHDHVIKVVQLRNYTEEENKWLRVKDSQSTRAYNVKVFVHSVLSPVSQYPHKPDRNNGLLSPLYEEIYQPTWSVWIGFQVWFGEISRSGIHQLDMAIYKRNGV